MRATGENVAKLKARCKSLRLRVGGTKKELEERIQAFEVKSRYAVKIQRTWRGHVVRRIATTQGALALSPALSTTCTNPLDFCTLEAIDQIPMYRRFVYTDDHGFVYGFDIESLDHILGNTHNANASDTRNPFDRRRIPDSVQQRARACILRYHAIERIREKRCNKHVNERANVQKKIRTTRVESDPTSIMMFRARSERSRRALASMSIERQVQQFAIETFQLIDDLGHYTTYEWVWRLDARRLHRFCDILTDIWNYRADLSAEMKRNILPPYGFVPDRLRRFHNTYYGASTSHGALTSARESVKAFWAGLADAAKLRLGDDFVDISASVSRFLFSIESPEDTQIQQIQHKVDHACATWKIDDHGRNTISEYNGRLLSNLLSKKVFYNQMLTHMRLDVIQVIECFVACGVDRDCRVLGAYYVLGALTMVSKEAATSMSWLHESFNYATFVQ